MVSANAEADSTSSSRIMTEVSGIKIPSASPIFLTEIGVHVLVGLVCVIAGIVAMLSEKQEGRHTMLGTIYFWSLAAVTNTPLGGVLEGGLSKKARIFARLRSRESMDDLTLPLKSPKLAIDVRPTVSALRCFHTSSSGFRSGEYGGR